MEDAAESPDSGPLEDIDDSQWQPSTEEAAQGDEGGPASGDTAQKPTIPLQKRRRVTRACDECRRKKIKCDGKQPCTHCTVYSYECTYDQPSNRRRNPAPQYIEALETRLNKAEALLRLVLPEVDLDDPKFEARGVEQILSMARQASHNSNQKKDKTTGPAPSIEEEARLESMVERTGTLDLDDNGNWDYHGVSSGFAFLKKLRAQMGPNSTDMRWLKKPKMIPPLIDSPRSASESPLDSNLPVTHDLPPKDVAKALCRNALDDCCALMRFVHQPTFYQKVDRIYSTDPERFSNTDSKFLPLLYSVLAVGCLFSSAEDNRLDAEGYEKGIGQGYQFFKAGRQLVNITDCRDMMGLQTICFMIMFLQASAKLSTCYAYVGVALRTCLRLGLHRDIQGGFDLIEREQRIRTFWLVWKMDAYVSAMLGLPQMLTPEDIDQVHPTEVDDDSITPGAILRQPPNKFPLIKGVIAHTKLVLILKKVMKYVYPVQNCESGVHLKGDNGYMISHSKIREIESDLQVWMDELPMELRPSDDVPQDLARVQQLLRISYAHIQMTMYRPFLHYSSNLRQNQSIDKRTFACAAACVSVSRNIVHITTEMKRRGLLIGAYWFVMYTTYFSIVSLVFFCLENPHSSIANSEILKDAIEGRETLAGLARRSLAADRCSTSLEALFKDLPEKMEQRRSASKSGPGTQAKKRALPKATAEAVQVLSNASSPAVPTVGEPMRAPQRARTYPHEVQTNFKRLSNPEQYRGLTVDSNGPRPGPQASWRLGPESGTLTPDSLKSNPGQGQTSPQQSNVDTQFDSTYLPDLENAMFPSNNPFAYPNQPMSTLEANQFKSSEEQHNTSTFYIPNSMPASNASYENVSSPVYGNFAPFITQSQAQLLGNQPGSYQGMPAGLDISPMQQGANMDPAHTNEDMWSQINGGRAGFTPGVNLDELFGNESWTPMWDHGAGPNPPVFK